MFFISCGTNQPLFKEKDIKVNKVYERFEKGEIKAIGEYSEDYLPFYNLRIGEWKEYYTNGNLKEVGKYEIGVYTNCCITGLCENYYNYKSGAWKFYFESGNLKSKGDFNLEKFQINTSCEGGDEIIFGIVNQSWEYFDEKGNEIWPTEELIYSVEATKSNGDFPSLVMSVDKKKGQVIFK